MMVKRERFVSNHELVRHSSTAKQERENGERNE